MPEFNGGVLSITPNTSNDNWTLSAVSTAHMMAKIYQFSWGGQLTTSAAYATRWVRPTAAGTTGTVITLGYGQPFYTAAGAGLCSTWTTQPVIPAAGVGNLFAQSWNAQGGNGVIVHPLDKEWWIQADTLIGQMSCRNTAGTDASGSTYYVSWKE